MPYISTKGIIISTAPLNERDKSAIFFSEELGKIRIKFRSVRSPTSKRSGYSDDFILERILLYRKGDFYTATEVELIDSYLDLKTSLDGFKALSYIKELLLILIPFEQQEPKVFNLLLKTLEGLRHTNFKDSAIIYFCIHLFDDLGYPIKIPRVVTGDYYFLPEKGGFNKVNGILIKEDIVREFQDVFNSSYRNFKEVHYAEEMLKIINSFVLFHSESEHFKHFLETMQTLGEG